MTQFADSVYVTISNSQAEYGVTYHSLYVSGRSFCNQVFNERMLFRYSRWERGRRVTDKLVVSWDEEGVEQMALGRRV